jgi:dTDP-4-dehydrorhamnose 3,5-epimerase
LWSHQRLTLSNATPRPIQIGFRIARKCGEHLAVELSAENQKQLFIPRGFAHGYACLSETALLSYKVDSHYNKASEASIAFDDPQLAIDWQIPNQLQKLSPKDLQHPTFEAARHFDFNTPSYD